MAGKKTYAPVVRDALGWRETEFDLRGPAGCEDVTLVQPTFDAPTGTLACSIRMDASGSTAADLPAGTPDQPLPLFRACEQADIQPGTLVAFWREQYGVPEGRILTVYPRPDVDSPDA
jgi:hypothetical protein